MSIKTRREEIAPLFEEHHTGFLYYRRRTQRKDAPRLLIVAGTHGCEIAGPLAAAELRCQLWIWGVDALVIWQDPVGYLDEGYGFVGPDGGEACWPVLWGGQRNEKGYWINIDENSTWGNNAIVPARHQAMRDMVDEFKPDFCLSLHETVLSETERNEFWAGSGLLTVETWPITYDEYRHLMNPVGSPLTDPVGWAVRTILDFFRPLTGIPKWKWGVRGLKDNSYYRLTTDIYNRYIELGGTGVSKELIRIQEAVRRPVLGPGRIMHDTAYSLSGWLTVTDYAQAKYGCPGVTTETFTPAALGIRGVEDRVKQQLLFIEATLETLEQGQ